MKLGLERWNKNLCV